VMRYLQYI